MRTAMKIFGVGFLICVLFLATTHDTVYATTTQPSFDMHMTTQILTHHVSPFSPSDTLNMPGPGGARRQQQQRQQRIHDVLYVICIMLVVGGLYMMLSGSEKKKDGDN